MLDGVWDETGRPQAIGPPFTSLKMLRTACLDLIGSVGNAEVKTIKRLQYRIETCQLSSLEKIDTTHKIICLRLFIVLETDLNVSVCIFKVLYPLIFNFFKLQIKRFL